MPCLDIFCIIQTYLIKNQHATVPCSLPTTGPNEITAVGNSSKSAKVSTNLGWRDYPLTWDQRVVRRSFQPREKEKPQNSKAICVSKDFPSIKYPKDSESLHKKHHLSGTGRLTGNHQKKTLMPACNDLRGSVMRRRRFENVNTIIDR